MKRLRFVALSLMLLFFILLFSETCNFTNLSQLTAEKGNILLPHTSIDQVYLLDGEWEVYDDQNNSLVNAGYTPEHYISIPEYWTKNEMPEGRKLYKLRVTTNLSVGTLMGFKVVTGNDCRLYIDNQLVFSADQRCQPVFHNTQSSELNIVVLLTDDVISAGNLGFRIYMGSPGDIILFHDSLMLKEELLIGALIIISIFFVALSYFMKNVRYTLNFSVVCFLIAIIIDIGNENIFTKQLALINTDISIFIWYTSYCLLMYFVILFLDELCSSHLSDIIKKIMKIVTVIEIVALVCIPVKYYSSIDELIMVMGLIVCLSAVAIVTLGIIDHVQDAWPNMFSLIILLVVFCHDGLLYEKEVIPPNKIYLYAVYLILVIQMMIQARRIKIYHEKKTQAELSFLQAQIKPHFLHNVMNTLISLSRYDIDKTRELLYDFSTYLLNSFNTKNFKQLVELKHEIELIEAYLKIEKARFEERLDFSIELPDSLEYVVPPLMIQPIIENAIIHGVLTKPEGGFVEIKIKVKNKKMEFLVRDNGVGISTKQRNELQYSQKQGSVGLINIQSRLQMLYSEELKIKSTYGIGTEITWQIPAIKKGIY